MTPPPLTAPNEGAAQNTLLNMAHSSQPTSLSRELTVLIVSALTFLASCQDGSDLSGSSGEQGGAPIALGVAGPPLLNQPQATTVRDARFEVQDTSRPNLGGLSNASQDGIERTTEEELLLRSARNALKLGNTAEALKFFDSYLLMRPEDVEVRIEYAGLLVGEGKLGLAKENYDEALFVRPSDAALLRSLANVLIMSGEYSSATRHLENVLKVDPDDLESAALLCRCYTWIRDFENADEVFDRYLRKLDPLVEADQLLLAPVLLDMQRPKEALPYLERLHRRFPQELRWATHMVLCYYLSGKRDRADRMVKTMAELEPESVELRIRLADQLLSLQNYKLAMDVNEQVLQASPDDPMARLMAARIHLEAYDVNGARSLLDDLRDELYGVRSYELARAKLHQLTGEWVVAQSILDMMLVDNSTDHDLRIRLASLLIEKGDIYRAIAELSKIPKNSPLGPRARLELATAKVVQGRIDEAISVCTTLVGDRPNDVEATLGLLRAQIEDGATVQAKYVAQRFIEECPSDAMGIGQVRLMLARALSMEGNNFQAVRMYEQALQEPTAQTPAAFYGLAEAKRRGISQASSELALLSSTMRASGEDIRLRIEFGKLALADQKHQRAIAYFEGVLRWQPGNHAAMVLLGEAQNMALKAGVDVDPVRTFSSVLSRNPENTRARLGLARALVVNRRYAEAISEYESVVAQDATYTFAQREYARALYWDHQKERAYEVYEDLLANLPTDAMVIDIFGQTGPDDVLGAELDFQAELELSAAVRLEREAKVYVNWQPELAIRALEQLLILEPANQEARFDLAQLLHRRGRTQDAIDEYEDLIELSSGHGEAVKVMEGARRETALRFSIDAGSEKLLGSDRLASITQNWTLADGPSFIPGNQFDLQGVMCHEYGHALGLGHSTVGSATMFPSASQGSTGIRSIATDDVNGVRCVYGDEANDKPRIESSTVNGNTLELFGANFSAFNNQVWFTRASNSSTGSDPRVIASSVASTQAGTAISVNIPAAAGPGNVMVVASGAANGSDMSNAWPFSLTDGFGDPPNPPMMVTGISPANIPALVPGTAETVTLTGSGFLGVQQVMFFIPPIDTQIDPSRWTIVNDTTITIDMPQALQLGSIPITVFDGQNFASINGNFVEVSSPQLQLGNGDAFNIVDTDFGMEVIVAGQVGSLHYLFGSANALPSSSPSVNLDIGNNFSSLIFLGTVTIGPDGYTTLNFTPAQLPNPPNAIVRYAQSIQLTLPTPVPVSNLGIVTFAP